MIAGVIGLAELHPEKTIVSTVENKEMIGEVFAAVFVLINATPIFDISVQSKVPLVSIVGELSSINKGYAAAPARPSLLG
jgi:hypothetical protein